MSLLPWDIYIYMGLCKHTQCERFIHCLTYWCLTVWQLTGFTELGKAGLIVAPFLHKVIHRRVNHMQEQVAAVRWNCFSYEIPAQLWACRHYYCYWLWIIKALLWQLHFSLLSKYRFISGNLWVPPWKPCIRLCAAPSRLQVNCN